jgi:geranylgeranyl pyrophosphate synthase
MRNPDELRSLVEEYIGELALTPELHGQAESVRYALVGGKRVRGVICLATAEAAGADAERALPAAASLELVQAFSLVHDDLPALDNDAERRGRPSTWTEFGEAVAVLAGDALLAEAFRLALSYPFPHVGRELAQATLGMIGGQYLDITNTAADEATLHKLKTGCLFAASVGLALWAA